MEGVFSIASRIAYFEVEPLSIVLGRIIWLKNQFIFWLINLYCFLKIAWFKSWFKEENIIFVNIIISILIFQSRTTVWDIPRIKRFEKSILHWILWILQWSSIRCSFSYSHLLLRINIFPCRLIMRWVLLNIIHSLCQIYNSTAFSHSVVLYYCLPHRKWHVVNSFQVRTWPYMLRWIQKKWLLNTCSWIRLCLLQMSIFLWSLSSGLLLH